MDTAGGNVLAELGIFAKYWQPGKVKTRLGQSIGNAAAADIYRLMLEVLTERLRQVADVNTIVYAPRERRSEFEELSQGEWHLEAQSDGDLGHRLSDFVKRAIARNEDQRVVLVGSDAPELTPKLVRHALDLLDQSSVVLGPSDDGGYYLIAMRGLQPVFDGIPWSTPEVFDATVGRLQQCNIPWAQLPVHQDIDTVFNLGDWILRMQQSKRPETVRLLSRLMEILDSHGVDVNEAKTRAEERLS